MIRVKSAAAVVLVLLTGCGSGSKMAADPGNRSEINTSSAGQRTGGGCNSNGIPFGGGSGKPDNPFLICTATQLEAMTNASDPAYYLLDSDLDLANGKHSCMGWAVIGVFDGGGHVIRNFNANLSMGQENGMLFCQLFTTGPTIAEIKNLRVENINVASSSQSATAGLVGSNHRGKITNVHVSGTITGGSRVGGIVADNFGIVEGSSFSGILKGESVIGGIAGTASEFSIQNCRVSGEISGESAIGGIVGEADEKLTLAGNQVDAKVSGKEDFGMQIGRKKP